MKPLTVIAVAVLALTLFPPLAADEPAEGHESESEAHATHEANEAGVFLGITAGGEDEGGGKEDATGTIGIEYRRNFSSKFGLDLLFEHAGGERRDHVGIIPASFMFGSHAQLIVGAGWERSSETEFLGRLGFGCSLELVPGNTIRPEINVDFVNGEHLIVIGASIGRGF